MIHFTLGGILAALIFIAYVLIRIEHKIYSNERKSVRKHEQKYEFCSSCISNKPNNAICDFCNNTGSKYKKAK